MKYLSIIIATLFCLGTEHAFSQTCTGKINFKSVSTICYDNNPLVSDLIYLEPGCSYASYSSLLIAVRVSGGNNQYIFNGVPNAATRINLRNNPSLKTVDAYSATTIYIKFVFTFENGSLGTEFEKQYQFVRGANTETIFPQTINIVGETGYPNATMPLSAIIGNGTARETNITCSTASLNYQSGISWNLHDLASEKNKWNVRHDFTIVAGKYLGCGIDTTLYLSTMIKPEFKFFVTPSAYREAGIIDLTAFVAGPKPDYKNLITYTGTFSCPDYPAAVNGNELDASLIPENVTCLNIEYTYNQYTPSMALYNTAKGSFSIPMGGELFSVSPDGNQTVCKGDKIDLTVSHSDEYTFEWINNGDTLKNSETYSIKNFYRNENITLTGKRTDGCTISKSIQLAVDSSVAAFEVDNNVTVISPGEAVRFISRSINASEFLWTFDEGDHSTKENPWHYFYIPGEHTVSLTVHSPGGCSNKYTNYKAVIVEGPSGIEQVKDNYLSITPNPAGNYLNLKTNLVLNDAGSISIFDLKGNLVANLKGTSSTIDISHIPSGIYLLKLSNNNKTIIRKFVKE
ncbi:MAG: T9SS type A sorting domain-containing protein [Bacteroidales bacterium]|nr:T9SS type A sorting domain-containing protein [Bacteroidales bacterium]